MVTIEFTWEVEDGYINHGPQNATLELSSDEAREMIGDSAALCSAMQDVAEEEFRQNVSYAVTTNADEAMAELRCQLEEEAEEEG